MNRIAQAALASGAAGVGALAYAALVERRWFALRHATLPVLRGRTRRPLRVLHLSDLHLPPGDSPIDDFVRALFARRPDVVVVTGDMAGHPRALDHAAELLSGRDGAIGIAVLGSNDRYGPTLKNPLRYFRPRERYDHGVRLDTDRLVAGLQAAGWELFENRRAIIDTPSGPVDVAGLADPHIGLDAPERIDWSPPGADVALRLGVVHSPYTRALDVFDRRGFDLVLAGHTHGGQVRVPGLGALVANCDLPLRQARGPSRYGVGLWLHVSAGAGQSRYAPIRFACRPEATLLDLVPARVD